MRLFNKAFFYTFRRRKVSCYQQQGILYKQIKHNFAPHSLLTISVQLFLTKTTQRL
jgi:hypothetical protein